MVDRRTGDWCRALIEAALEVPAGKLPEIRPAAEIAGPVTASTIRRSTSSHACCFS